MLSAARGDELEQVVIQGTRYTSKVTVGSKTPEKLREIPSSVSVITEQRIEDQKFTTLAEALTGVTGVTVIPNDGTQSQYKSRGYALAVMNDGVPASSALSGYQQYDLAIYERVEVLRGPAGVLQGSSDPGGTVNLVRKRGRDEFGASTSFTGGSWDDYRAVVDVTGPMNESRSLRARLVGTYQDRDSFVHVNTDTKSLGYATLDWDVGSNTTLSASLIAQNDRDRGPYLGLPAAQDGGLLHVPRSTGLAQDWEIYKWQTYDYSMGATQRFSDGWVIKLTVSRRDQSNFSHDSYTWDPVNTSTNTVPYVRREYDYDYQRRSADLFLSGPVRLFGRTHSLLIGYNYDSLDTTYGGVSLVSDAQAIVVPFDRPDLVPDFHLPYNEGGETKTLQRGFYAQARVSVTDPLTIVGGARYSDFDIRSRNIAPSVPSAWKQGNKDENKLTPYGGVVYDLTRQISLYTSYSETFIPQSTLLKADRSALDPREGRQYELGSKGEFLDGRLNASVAIFKLRDRNRPLSDSAHPGFYVSAGEVESKGWEAELSGSPAPGYEVQAGYTRLDTQYLTATPAQQGQIFDALEPRHSWKVWAVRRFREREAAGVTLGLGFNTQSGITSTPLRSEGGFTVASALLRYRVSGHLDVDFNANNLLDKVYYSRLGGSNLYNTYGDPRDYSVTVRASF
jgi:outer membrane receptor for ferric coprogen and ferric-rhodotorulic acid